MTDETLIVRLEKNRVKRMETEDRPTHAAIEFYNLDRVGGFAAAMLVPHYENYHSMLGKLREDDVVCDMGAGDLRFDLMAVDVCRKAYAVELSPFTIADALKIIGYKIPRNLIPICADWRFFDIPNDVTVVVCMVNIGEECLPVDVWKQNNRRVYHGVVASGGLWVGYDEDGIKEF